MHFKCYTVPFNHIQRVVTWYSCFHLVQNNFYFLLGYWEVYSLLTSNFCNFCYQFPINSAAESLLYENTILWNLLIVYDLTYSQLSQMLHNHLKAIILTLCFGGAVGRLCLLSFTERAVLKFYYYFYIKI